MRLRRVKTKALVLLLFFCSTETSFSQQDKVSVAVANHEPAVSEGTNSILQLHRFIFDNSGGTMGSTQWRNSFSLGMDWPPGLVSDSLFLHWSGFFIPPPPPAHVIQGFVMYYAKNLPVPQTTVILFKADGDSLQKTTDSQGKFRFENVYLPASLVATKTAGFDSFKVITNADANRVSSHVRGKITLKPAEIIASDVDRSNSVTIRDSVFISDFAFRRPRHPENHTGEWQILTPDLERDTLRIQFGDTLITTNFTAILLGDNNGNWEPVSTMSKTTAPQKMGPPISLQVAAGDTFHVPVAFPPKGSFEFAEIQLRFDAAMMQYLGMKMNNRREEVLSRERRDDGFVEIDLATNPLSSGERDTLLLAFNAKAEPGATAEIRFLKFSLDDVDYPLPQFKILFIASIKLPERFALYQNYPNPFNPSTTIRFDIPPPGGKHAKLIIYDLQGRQVRTLRDESLAAGRYTVEWDGRNEAGEGVASGVYIYRLQTTGFVQTRKLIVLR